MLPDPRYSPFCWPFYYSISQTTYSQKKISLAGTGDAAVPKQGDWIRLCVDGAKSYGILADGSLWAWMTYSGPGGSQPLPGDGTLNRYEVPTKVSDGPWADVACAAINENWREGAVAVIHRDGSLWTWGSNSGGQLGNGMAWPRLQYSPRLLLDAPIESVALHGYSSGRIELDAVTGEPYAEVGKHKSSDPGSGAEFNIGYHWSLRELAVTGYLFQWLPYSGKTPEVTVDAEGEPAVLTPRVVYRVAGVDFGPDSWVAPDAALVFETAAPLIEYIATTASAVSNGQGGFTIANKGVYRTPPKVTLIGRASSQPRLILEVQVTGINIIDGGKYTEVPSQISLTHEGQSIPITFATKHGAITADSCEVVSGGSGYTSNESDRLSVRLRVPGVQSWPEVGEAKLAPGPVVAIESPYEFPEQVRRARINPFEFEVERPTAPGPPLETDLFDYYRYDLHGATFGFSEYPLAGWYWPPRTHNPPFLPLDADPPSRAYLVVNGQEYELDIERSTSEFSSEIPLGRSRFKISLKEHIYVPFLDSYPAIVEFDEQEFPVNVALQGGLYNTRPVVAEGELPQNVQPDFGANISGPNVFGDMNKIFWSYAGYAAVSGVQEDAYPTGCWERGVDYLEGYDAEIIKQATPIDDPVLLYWTSSPPYTPVYSRAMPPIQRMAFGYNRMNDSPFYGPDSLNPPYYYPEFRSSTRKVPPRVIVRQISAFDNLGDSGSLPPPSMTQVCRHHGGSGVDVGVAFANSQDGRWASATLSIQSGGQGYTVEPEVTLTSDVLSPQMLDSGNWSSLVAGGDRYLNRRSFAAIKNGAAYTWGGSRPTPGSLNRTQNKQLLSPTKVTPVFREGYPTDYDNIPLRLRLSALPGIVHMTETFDPKAPPPAPGSIYSYQAIIPPAPYSRDIVDPYIYRPNEIVFDETVEFAENAVTKIFNHDLFGLCAVSAGCVWAISGYNFFGQTDKPHVCSPESLLGDVKQIYGMKSTLSSEWNWRLDQKVTSWIGVSYQYNPQSATGGVWDRVECFTEDVKSDVCRYDSRSDNHSSEWAGIIRVHPVPFNKWTLVVTNGGSNYSGGIAVRLSGGKLWNSVAPGTTLNSYSTEYSVETQDATSEQLEAWVDNPLDGVAGYKIQSLRHNPISESDPPETSEFTVYAHGYNNVYPPACSVYQSREVKSEKWPDPMPKKVKIGGILETIISPGSVGPVTTSQYPTGVSSSIYAGQIMSIDFSGTNSRYIVEENGTVMVPTVEIIDLGGTGSGAQAIFLPTFKNTSIPLRHEQSAYPRCLTQPHRKITSESVSDACTGRFIAGGDLHGMPTTGGTYDKVAVPLHPAYSLGSQIESLHSGDRGISSDGELIWLGNSFDKNTPADLGNIEFLLNSGGSNFRTIPRIVVSQPSSQIAVADVTIDGKLVGIGVVDGGRGFTSPPFVSTDGGAQAEAVISGPVREITVTSPGYGYVIPPRVVFSGPGLPATATCQINQSGGVQFVGVQSGGTYRSPPQVSFVPDWSVDRIDVTSGGEYESAPSVVLVGGSGEGATANCIFDPESRRVTAVVVSSAGSGYETPPTVFFTGGGGTGASATAYSSQKGTGAAAEASIDGSVIYCKITNQGSGYQFSPEVTATATAGNNYLVRAAWESGKSAEEIASIVESASPDLDSRIEGAVSQIEITSPGSFYYASPPQPVYPPSAIQRLSKAWAWSPKEPTSDWDDYFNPRVWSFAVAQNGGVTNVASEAVGGSLVPVIGPSAARHLQKPVVRFFDSVHLQVESVRRARRTARSVRDREVVVPATSGLRDFFNSHGVSYWGASVAVSQQILSSSWLNRAVSTTGGQTVMLRDVRFSEPPLFVSQDSLAGEHQLSCSLDASGKIASISANNFPEGSFSGSTRLKLKRAMLAPQFVTLFVTVDSLGRVELVSPPPPQSEAFFLSPKIVVLGEGSGCSAVAFRQPGNIATVATSVIVTDSGSGYRQETTTAVMYEGNLDFLKTDFGIAFLSQSASWQSFLVSPTGGTMKPEYCSPPPADLIPTAKATDVLSMYEPQSFVYPASGYGSELLGKSFPYIDQYAEFDTIETTKYLRHTPRNTYAGVTPTVEIQGVFEEPPSVTAVPVKWTSAFQSLAIRDTTT